MGLSLEEVAKDADACKPAVLRYVRAKMRSCSPEVHEDLVSEAICKLLECAKRGDVTSLEQMRSLLFRIARFRCVDHIRKSKREDITKIEISYEDATRKVDDLKPRPQSGYSLEKLLDICQQRRRRLKQIYHPQAQPRDPEELLSEERDRLAREALAEALKEACLLEPEPVKEAWKKWMNRQQDQTLPALRSEERQRVHRLFQNLRQRLEREFKKLWQPLRREEE